MNNSPVSIALDIAQPIAVGGGTKVVSKARANAGNTHIAGEMFVAAELAKRGYSVSLTMGNAKAVDLFAEHDGQAICIQVKAIARKKNVGWPLPFEKRKIIDRVIYVCVVLNEIGSQPTYYVLPPEEVRKRGKWYTTRAILDLGTVRGTEFEGAWHLIDKELAKSIQVISSIVAG
jgi:PD-(D/E)XK endonuclease